MYKPIIVLVGPSGAGKTTCMLRLVRHFDGNLGIIRSVTTREPRDDEDLRCYEFVTREVFEEMRSSDQFIQCDAPYTGTVYASAHRNIQLVTANRYGICALTEQGVLNHRAAGLEVLVIKMQSDNPAPVDPARAAADAERDKIDVNPDLEVFNTFAPGGLDRTMKTLIEYLHTIIHPRLGCFPHNGC